MEKLKYFVVFTFFLLAFSAQACNLLSTNVASGGRTVSDYVESIKIPLSKTAMIEFRTVIESILSPIALPESLPQNYKIQRVLPRDSGIFAKSMKVPEINIIISNKEIVGDLNLNTLLAVTTDTPPWKDFFNTVGDQSVLLTLYCWKGYPVPSSYDYEAFLPPPENNKTAATEQISGVTAYYMSDDNVQWAEWRLPNWDKPQYIIRAATGKAFPNEQFKEIISSITSPVPETLLAYPAETYSKNRLFPDPNLEKAIRKAIKKPEGDLQPDDVKNLKALSAQNMNIISLSGLEKCPNLQKVDFTGNHIFDLSPLKYLSNLTEVNFTGNEILNIQPLINCYSLQKVELGYNRISDIKPLSALTEISYLDLGWNLIKEISAVTTLLKLTHLDLGNNQIEDISALSKLDNLTYLYLTHNHIQDISLLTDLKEIQNLFLNDNNIQDVSSLLELNQLRNLGLYNNEINDISAILKMEQLENLDVSKNEISDLSFFSNAVLPNLHQLNLAYNDISDINPVSDAYLPNIKSINLRGNNLNENDIPENLKNIIKI